MAEEPAEELELEEEEEGGPVKSFLEHLEDLRWVLIKSIVAAGVAMLGCLFAGNYVVRVLEWPLNRAPLPGVKGQNVRLVFGTNQLATFHVTATNDPLVAYIGTNRFVRLEITPLKTGDNVVLSLKPPQDDAD